jgi:lipoprotein-releasing system ATP-binding protein
MNNIFSIKNLHCEYKKNQPVLLINHLEIPKGKLVFIIGRSGIGKSTLIETLGLMNNTISLSTKDCTIQFKPTEQEQYELRDSWSKNNEELSTLRRKHFSFIFQSTNLMPNFSSGENMAISLLIKGKSFKEAQAEVAKMMALSLSNEIFDKKITEISGGQRQRLAFVRAITADFSVLFGDEPTGNLDSNTAEELMSILKEDVREKSRTAIIVSHDLLLADAFADVIIPITSIKRDDGLMGGNIDENNILTRNDANKWIKKDGSESTETLHYLNSFLTTI